MGWPSLRAITYSLFRRLAATKSAASRTRHSTTYPSRSSIRRQRLNVCPRFSGTGSIMTRPPASLTRFPAGHTLARIGPHVVNSGTFSTMITRGATALAHAGTIHARSRTLLETGAAPRAREKWRQSGDAHKSPTGRPAATTLGSLCQMSLWR